MKERHRVTGVNYNNSISHHTQLKMTIKHKLILAAVAVVKKMTPELVMLSLPKLVSTTNIDILYKTTPNTAATAKQTSRMTIVKLNTVAGNFIRQNGGCGSLELVTKSIRIFLTFCRRAKYCGRGCSSCTSNPVKSQR